MSLSALRKHIEDRLANGTAGLTVGESHRVEEELARRGYWFSTLILTDHLYPDKCIETSRLNCAAFFGTALPRMCERLIETPCPGKGRVQRLTALRIASLLAERSANMTFAPVEIMSVGELMLRLPQELTMDMNSKVPSRLPVMFPELEEWPDASLGSAWNYLLHALLNDLSSQLNDVLHEARERVRQRLSHNPRVRAQFDLPPVISQRCLV